jgi:hypothetical protein
MRIYRLIATIVLEIMFILLKISGNTEMNLGGMLLPIVVWVFIEIVSIAAALIIQLLKNSSKEKKELAWLILIQLILIIIKLIFYNQLQCISWFAILLPIEIPALGVLMIISGMKVFKIIEGKKDKEE